MGWMAFFTLLVIVWLAYCDSVNAVGRAFGWPAPMAPWGVVIPSLAVVWIVYLAQKFHVIYFWFQVP